MEKLSAFDLTLLSVAIRFAIEEETASRFKVANEHLYKRLLEEISTRPVDEINAGLADVSRIEPALAKSAETLRGVLITLKKLNLVK
jgi:hypothetical protein